MAAWYRDGKFWEVWQRYLFPAARLAHTPYEIDRAIELLQLQPGEQVLDVCCGTGRHLLELGRRGYRTTGVDLNSTYLAAARARAETEGLHVELVQADVRELVFPPVFGGAVNMYTSFGYFDDYNDDLRCARNIHNALKPGRRFLIETEGKEIMARNYRAQEWFWHDDGSIGLQQRTIRDGWERMDIRWILVRNGLVEWDGTISSRIYSAREMRSLLIAAGFADVKVFGSLAATAYDHTAVELIAVATE
jgi:SAM-dependent methyltransferase